MITLLGTVYRVIYKSPQENYCVFVLRDYQEDTHTCAGNIAPPKVGEEVEAVSYTHLTLPTKA